MQTIQRSPKSLGAPQAVDPEDWQIRAKLIQTYQSLGKLSERDAERGALFELRRHDANGGLAKEAIYCREQFEAGGETVMVFEYFELKGDRALRYVFSIVDESRNDEKYRLSLGSYQVTNAVWHEPANPGRRPLTDFFISMVTTNGGTLPMECTSPSHPTIKSVLR
jgi:hypothetical protein